MYHFLQFGDDIKVLPLSCVEDVWAVKVEGAYSSGGKFMDMFAWFIVAWFMCADESAPWGSNDGSLSSKVICITKIGECALGYATYVSGCSRD